MWSGKENDRNKSLKYINSKFNEIEKPSLKTIYEMGNIVKSFQRYDLSIKYYTEVLSKLDPTSIIYADVLYRRGGSYERIGNEEKADKDLLKSLEINPDEPHVLNYLAETQGYKATEDAVRIHHQAGVGARGIPGEAVRDLQLLKSDFRILLYLLV